jgi:hypothetical protein
MRALALLLLLCFSAHAQPLAYVLEVQTMPGVTELRCYYSLPEAQAWASMSAVPSRIVAVPQPLARSEVARLWAESKRLGAGVDQLAAFAELVRGR